MNIPVHIYECPDCILVFAAEMAFEDQSEICCPNCGNEDINDIAAGEMTFKKSIGREENEPISNNR